MLLSDSLLDTAPCGFLTFIDDGSMIAVNRTLSDMLGYSRAELEGWHLQKVFTSGSRVFYNTHLFPLLRMHGSAEEIFLVLLAKDGSEVPVLVNGIRREREGRTVNDCTVVRISHRARYEEELLQARRQAERASDAKAKFLSMMSHDLRTPLTSIAGHADVLLKGFDGPLNPEQLESVQTIASAAREVGRLIDDILSFAQLESGKVRVTTAAVPISEAIARAEALVRIRFAEANLSFSSSGCTADLVVQTDPDRLQQILLNLLTNAVKFTPPGGSIGVRCERRDDRVLIHVRDTGIGIPVEDLGRVFEAFVQLDAKQHHEKRGVGLGLAISRDLARALGGELTAASQPGTGSTFTLDLPAGSPITITA